jgi:hypothetical protein
MTPTPEHSLPVVQALSAMRILRIKLGGPWPLNTSWRRTDV